MKDFMTNAKNIQNTGPSPLLFFDSGLGGLSILRQARQHLPFAPVIYVGDYGGLPYGERSEREISARVPAILGRLAERYRPSLITIACNTASVIALAGVRAALDLPVVGTVPAIKPAGELSKTRVIGLLGTSATIRQAYVDNLHAQFAPDTRLLRYGAGSLVHAAEAIIRGLPVDSSIFDEAVAGLADQEGGENLDVIIMACTHFPLVADELKAAARRAGLRDDLQFIDGADGIARRIQHLTRRINWPETRAGGVFVTTGPFERSEKLDNLLISLGLDEIESMTVGH